MTIVVPLGIVLVEEGKDLCSLEAIEKISYGYVRKMEASIVILRLHKSFASVVRNKG